MARSLAAFVGGSDYEDIARGLGIGLDDDDGTREGR